MEINGDVTDAGRTDDEQTREDRATQPMEAGWLSFAIILAAYHKSTFDYCLLSRVALIEYCAKRWGVWLEVVLVLGGERAYRIRMYIN